MQGQNERLPPKPAFAEEKPDDAHVIRREYYQRFARDHKLLPGATRDQSGMRYYGCKNRIQVIACRHIESGIEHTEEEPSRIFQADISSARLLKYRHYAKGASCAH